MPRFPVVPLVLALALGACSGGTSSAAGSGPAAPATVTVTATVSPPASASGGASPTVTPSRSASASAPGGSGVAEFVRVVRAKVPDVASGRSTAEITAIAVTACRLLRGGAPAEEISAAAQSLGTLDAEATDGATANELVKLAMDTTCPDQASRVDEFQPLQR